MPILTDSKNFIQNEFSNLNLGDERLNRRALVVASTINANPAFSIPAMTDGNDGQLKAIYRFFQNPKVDDQKLLQTHYLNTIDRMINYKGKILLVCDSCFISPAKGFDGLMTRGKGKDNCIRSHYCLAISEDGKHLLGILDIQFLSDPINRRHPELRDESDIWIFTAQNCIDLINMSSQGNKLLSRCIFVADREADEFELINFLKKSNLGFVIRSQYDRKIIFESNESKLNEIESFSKGHGSTYTVTTLQKNKKVDVLVKRSVLRNVIFIPPITVEKSYLPIEVNIVLVQEVPGEINELKWRLITSENIDNSSNSQEIVTYYSHRWKIEEVNKGAKTGVRIEERQFTDASHCISFLAMAFVVAWRMVALRTVAEISPKTPIEEAFTSEEVAYMKEQTKEMDLPMHRCSGFF